MVAPTKTLTQGSNVSVRLSTQLSHVLRMNAWAIGRSALYSSGACSTAFGQARPTNVDSWSLCESFECAGIRAGDPAAVAFASMHECVKMCTHKGSTHSPRANPFALSP